jgi:hypothetical protein
MTDPCCSVCREIGGPHGVPDVRDRLAEALPEHWGASDRAELVDALLPVVESISVRRVAAEIEQIAETRAWLTQHDNEAATFESERERLAEVNLAAQAWDRIDRVARHLFSDSEREEGVHVWEHLDDARQRWWRGQASDVLQVADGNADPQMGQQ